VVRRFGALIVFILAIAAVPSVSADDDPLAPIQGCKVGPGGPGHAILPVWATNEGTDAVVLHFGVNGNIDDGYRTSTFEVSTSCVIGIVEDVVDWAECEILKQC
jgi:hypothetical protein